MRITDITLCLLNIGLQERSKLCGKFATDLNLSFTAHGVTNGPIELCMPFLNIDNVSPFTLIGLPLPYVNEILKHLGNTLKSGNSMTTNCTSKCAKFSSNIS